MNGGGFDVDEQVDAHEFFFPPALAKTAFVLVFSHPFSALTHTCFVLDVSVSLHNEQDDTRLIKFIEEGKQIAMNVTLSHSVNKFIRVCFF